MTSETMPEIITNLDPYRMIFSASQVDTFLLCPRKWGWQYLDGFKPEPNASAALGTEVHAQLEAWLRDAKPLDLSTRAGLVALPLINHIPQPRTCDVERAFTFELFEYSFRGFKDFERGPDCSEGLARTKPGFVGDHKTSTDPEKWGKSADDLRKDTQAILYAAEHLFFYDSESVELHWNYTRTSGSPKAFPVWDGSGRPIITRGECEPVLERTHDAAKAMTSHVGKKALDLEPNASACKAFGGCPHVERCNLSPQEKVRSLFHMGDKEDLIRKMQGNANLPPAGAAQAVNPATTPAPFTDGQPWWNGTGWVLPGTEPYARARAVFCAPPTPPVTPPAQLNGTALTSAAAGQTVEVEIPAESIPEAVQQAAEAAAPKRGRGRPKKIDPTKPISGVTAAGELVQEEPHEEGATVDFFKKKAALAGLAQALIDLGEALAELAE